MKMMMISQDLPVPNGFQIWQNTATVNRRLVILKPRPIDRCRPVKLMTRTVIVYLAFVVRYLVHRRTSAYS